MVPLTSMLGTAASCLYHQQLSYPRTAAGEDESHCSIRLDLPAVRPCHTFAGSDAFEGYVGVLQMAQSVTLAAEGGQMPSQQEMQAKLAAFQQVRVGGKCEVAERAGPWGFLENVFQPWCCLARFEWLQHYRWLSFWRHVLSSCSEQQTAAAACAPRPVSHSRLLHQPPLAAVATMQERVTKLAAQLRERLATYATLGKEGFEQVGICVAVGTGRCCVGVCRVTGQHASDVCLPAIMTKSDISLRHVRHTNAVLFCRPCGQRPTGWQRSTLAPRCCKPSATSTRGRAPRWACCWHGLHSALVCAANGLCCRAGFAQ